MRSLGWKSVRILTYHYEVNCLEYRPGTGVPVTPENNTGMYVPQLYATEALTPTLRKRWCRLRIQAPTFSACISMSSTSGTKGQQRRASEQRRSRTSVPEHVGLAVERYETTAMKNGKDDELGFKTFTEFLNCYANNAYAGRHRVLRGTEEIAGR